MNAIARLVLMSLAMIAVAGCVAGQSLQTVYESPAAGESPAATATNPASVQIAVTDDRAFVKSGEKPPYYLGKYRAGFGNPWDVKTENEEPLANIVARDLAADLTASGYRVVTSAPADRAVAVSILDWNFDGYQNGRLWYDLLVTVSDSAGQALAKSPIKEELQIKGTLMMGARGGFEREMPKLYSQIIRKIVRDNPETSAALARRDK